ncbi:hypothetical protein J4405_03520 [Candidatus Woesearchaeota archaeon]|nr:hypothetical protein [Candidatus Woesearchaeota archaeon]
MNKKGISGQLLIGLVIAVMLIFVLIKFIIIPSFGTSEEEKQYYYDIVNAQKVPANRLEKLNTYDELIENAIDTNDADISVEFVKALILESNPNVDEKLKNDLRAGLLPLDAEIATKYGLMIDSENDERLIAEKNLNAGVAYLKYLHEKVHDDKNEKDDMPYIVLGFYKGYDVVLSSCPVGISGGFENCDVNALVNVPVEKVIVYEKTLTA